MYLQPWIKVEKERSGCCRKKFKDGRTPDAEHVSEAKSCDSLKEEFRGGC